MIVCVGLATRDTIYAVPRHPRADDLVVASDRVVAGGGPAATAAVAIARLGVPVRFVGVVDTMPEGVELVRMPGRMVESTILVSGEARSIVTETPALFELPDGVLDGADWVHVDHVGWAALRETSAGHLLSVDAGHRIADLDLERIDLYVPTQEMFDGRRATLTVVTKGSAGCTVYRGDETFDVPAFEGVDVVSTLGAGDVFHGALVACLARELELRDALHHASVCAALSCRALDGRSEIPTWAELERHVA